MSKKKDGVEYVENIDDALAQNEKKTDEKGDKQKKFFETRKDAPDACVSCRGSGAPCDLDDEAEAKLSDDVLECPDCLARGICPKCAKKFPKEWKQVLANYIEGSEKPLTCKNCKWQDGDPPVLSEKPFDSGR